MPPLVSTIIPVYNRPKMLEQAIQCVLNQTYKNLEIIIVDDGSTDGATAQVGRRFAERFDFIRYIHQENRGPGPARNTGVSNAHGAYIQFLDSDDYLLPEKFERQVGDLEAHPECGLSYSLTHRRDEKGVESISHQTDKRFDDILPYALRQRIWHTVSPLWRRSSCEHIGEWSSLRAMEDWEYDIRAGILGIKPFYTPQPLSIVADHGEDRASMVAVGCPDAVWVDWLEAYKIIYGHITKAGLQEYLSEVRFAEDVFRVARVLAVQRKSQLCSRALALSNDVARTSTLKFKILLFKRIATVLGYYNTTVLLEFFRNGIVRLATMGTQSKRNGCGQ